MLDQKNLLLGVSILVYSCGGKSTKYTSPREEKNDKITASTNQELVSEKKNQSVNSSEAPKIPNKNIDNSLLKDPIKEEYEKEVKFNENKNSELKEDPIIIEELGAPGHEDVLSQIENFIHSKSCPKVISNLLNGEVKTYVSTNEEIDYIMCKFVEKKAWFGNNDLILYEIEVGSDSNQKFIPKRWEYCDEGYTVTVYST